VPPISVTASSLRRLVSIAAAVQLRSTWSRTVATRDETLSRFVGQIGKPLSDAKYLQGAARFGDVAQSQLTSCEW
jgi:hypothetical protein